VCAACGLEHVVLGGRGRAEDFQIIHGAAQLQHCRPDPAGRHMHQHSLAGADARDAEQHVVGGQVADRYRGGFLEAHRIWHRQHLLRGHADHIGMSPETGQGQHPLACRVALGAGAEPVDHPGHLVADDARRLGGIGIQALGGHYLREVQAGRADTNADLARAGLRIGRFPHLQGLGPAMPSDPDRSHRHNPPWKTTHQGKPVPTPHRSHLSSQTQPGKESCRLTRLSGHAAMRDVRTTRGHRACPPYGADLVNRL
jgi:hypothetical protein